MEDNKEQYRTLSREADQLRKVSFRQVDVDTDARLIVFFSETVCGDTGQ